VWLPELESKSGSGPASLILRPEALRVAVGALGADNLYPGEIEDVVYLGGSCECRVKIGALRLSATVPSAAAGGLRPGAAVSIGWNANDGVVVDAG
jgi:hypothetical protein